MIADAVVFGCFALRSLTLADKPFQGYWRQDLDYNRYQRLDDVQQDAPCH